MKRLIVLMATIILLSTSTIYASGEDWAIGTVINKVLATDIKAYVNGYEIPSMNIDGRTAIIVEDLRNYGFDVVWNPGKRTLTINENTYKSIEPISIDKNENIEIGTKIKDVLYTDIKTFIGDNEVRSFNIGGYTAIYIDSLDKFGDISWSEENREIAFKSQSRNIDNKFQEEKQDNSFIIKQISDIEFYIKFSDDGKMFLDEKEIGFAYGTVPMLSLKALSDKFSYTVLKDGKSFIAEDKVYGFKVTENIKKAQIYYNKGLIGEAELNTSPIERNNDLYISQYDLKRLFGYGTSWDKEERILNILYSNYEVEEYGMPNIGADEIKLKAELIDASYKPGIRQLPSLRVCNAIKTDTGVTYNNRYSNLSFKDRRDGRNVYNLESMADIHIGNNDIIAVIEVNNRVLFYKEKNIVGDITKKELELITFGPFTNLELHKPEKGYTKTNNSRYLIKGTVTDAVERHMVVITERLNEEGYFQEINRENLLINEKEFEHYLDFNNRGLYRISIKYPEAGPHGQVLILITSFYIDYNN